MLNEVKHLIEGALYRVEILPYGQNDTARRRFSKYSFVMLNIVKHRVKRAALPVFDASPQPSWLPQLLQRRPRGRRVAHREIWVDRQCLLQLGAGRGAVAQGEGDHAGAVV